MLIDLDDFKTVNKQCRNGHLRWSRADVKIPDP
jgi:hypothetical protein